MKEVDPSLTQPVGEPGKDFSYFHFIGEQSEAHGQRPIPLALCPLWLVGQRIFILSSHRSGPLPTVHTLRSSSCHPLEPFGGGRFSAGAVGPQGWKGLGAINHGGFSLLSCLPLFFTRLANSPQCWGERARLAQPWVPHLPHSRPGPAMGAVSFIFPLL